MVRPRSSQWQEGALSAAGADLPDGESSAVVPEAVVPAVAVSSAEPVAPVVAGWVEPEWWLQVVSPAVREVMVLAPGLALMAALAALPTGVCQSDHSAEADVASGEVLRWWAPEGPVETVVTAGTLPDGSRVRMPAPGSVPGLPCACQLVVAAGWTACAAWVGGRVADSVIDVVGPGPLLLHSEVHPDRLDPAGDELAAVLHVSPRSASSQIGAARRRAACAPVAVTVDAGLLGAAGGAAVYQVLDHVPTDTADKVSRTLSARIRDRRAKGLRGWTPAEARRAARAALLAYAPDQAEQARSEAVKLRRVEVRPVGDGTSWLSALLPELDALRIHRRLSALGRAQAADATPEDRRLLDQRRADLLTEALLSWGSITSGATGGSTVGHSGAAESAGAPGERGTVDGSGASRLTGGRGSQTGTRDSGLVSEVQICVVATAETLLGLSQQPAHVPGIGAVPADLARELAAEGTWRIWLRNAAGQITAVDPGRYRPTAAVARLIAAREPVCRFPGCLVRVDRCDLDHTEPWPAAPGSAPENLGPLCRRHHNAKTHHGIVLTAQSTGGQGPVMLERWTWRMPSGLTHTLRSRAVLDEDLGTLPRRRRRQKFRPVRTTRSTRSTRKNSKKGRNSTHTPHGPMSPRRLRT